MNSSRSLHRFLAFLCFLLPFIIYAITLPADVTDGLSGMWASAVRWGGVPAAPGAPLWTMAAGAFAALESMLGIDPRLAVHVFTAVCGALAAMVLYLATTTLLEVTSDGDDDGRWQGVLAALSFAFFDATWGGVERIGPHTAGALLAALVLWTALRWYRGSRIGEPGAPLWLLLSAWCLGLSIGVDRGVLSLLPVVLLLVWLRFWQGVLTNPHGDQARAVIGGILAMVGLLLLWYVFGAIALLIVLLIVIVVALAMTSSQERRRPALLFLFAALFILAGYSTYVASGLRAAAAPPLQESDMAKDGEIDKLAVWGYADSFFPTPPSTGPNPFNADRSVRAAVGTEFTPALLRSLVGRVSDHPRSPTLLFSADDDERRDYLLPSGREDELPVRFFAIPLLFALIGFVRLYRDDWRLGLTMTAAFISAGPLLYMLYAPSARDTFMLPALLIVALWIGLGGGVLVDLIRRGLRQAKAEELEIDEEDDAALTPEARESVSNAVRGTAVLCLLAVPGLLLWQGWKLHDRSDAALSADFARNMLVGLQADAILFIDDHDLDGLLRYQQDVSGVRRDVRVVNIERLNTPPYYDARYYERLRSADRWDSKPLELDEWRKEWTRTTQGITDTMPPTLPLPYRNDTADRIDTALWVWQGIEQDSASILYTPTHQIIREIVEENIVERPIYFALTTDERWWSGLETTFRWEGLAYRLDPGSRDAGVEGFAEYPIDREAMHRLLSENDDVPDSARFFFRGLADASITHTTREQRMAAIYRRAYLAAAADALLRRDSVRNDEIIVEGKELLAAMDERISLDAFPMDYWTAAAAATLFREAGDKEGTSRYAAHAIARAEAMGDLWTKDAIARGYNPTQVTAEMEALLGDYDAAIERYRSMSKSPDTDALVRGLIEELRVDRHLAAGDTAAAVRELDEIVAEYGEGASGALGGNRDAWRGMAEELRVKQRGDTAVKAGR